ncbi:hypothetical protein [Polyangium spumosum]|uniref:Uncharacterized protein n=1 Tax=Polyangium spumosum TaxID=889282 RepID=A0A6N7Q8N0_9BACT|nr:hypothetical protein [Polyangium spumosum]MRG98614.1 hypothetical protein [Polyangium spumosum]
MPFLRRAGVLVVEAPRGARASNLYRIDVEALDRSPEESPSARRTRPRKGGVRVADGSSLAEVRAADGMGPPGGPVAEGAEVRAADGGGPPGGRVAVGAEVRAADGSSLAEVRAADGWGSPGVRVADGGGPRGGPEALSLDHDQKDPERDPEREATKARSSKRRARGAARGEAGPYQVGLVGIASASDGGEAPKRRKPLLPMPDGWAPSPRMRQWALAQAEKAGLSWTDADVDHEIATFCGLARAKDQRWADWGAAWENWIRRGIKFAWKQGKTEDRRTAGAGPRRAVGLQPLGDACDKEAPPGLFDSDDLMASPGGGYL